MEKSEAPTPFNIPNYEAKLIESKKYILKHEENIYSVLMETYSDNYIYFKIRKYNNLSLYHYINKYNYEDITKLFLLHKEHYTNISKVFHFFDLAFTKEKIKLDYNKEKNIIILKLNKIIDFDEIECKLELNENKIQKDEMFNLLIDEINEIKSNKKENKENNNLINELKIKNIEYENRIKNLEDKINILDDELKNYKRLIHEFQNYNKNNNSNNLNEKDDTKTTNKLINLDKNNIWEYFNEFSQIRKNLYDPNNKYLMISSDRNQGEYIIKYLLNKINKKYVELIPSKLTEDIKNEKYMEEVIENIKKIIKNDNILILKNFDTSLYDIFTKKLTVIDGKKYLETKFKSQNIFAEVNNNFYLIIIENNNEKSELLKDKFEKQVMKYDIFLEEKDRKIIDNISKYLDLLLSFNRKKRLKIYNSLLNCQKDDIEGLIFQIKVDLKIKNNSNKNHWIFNDNQEYENNLLKLIFNRIVLLFPQDIIASAIWFSMEFEDEKYLKMKELILNFYEKSHFNNFESYFKTMNSKRSLIYTFSKDSQYLFKKIKNLENKFGVYDELSVLFLTVESIKKENDFITDLKSFLNSKCKKIIIIIFKEADLNNLYSFYLIINNIEKEYPELKNKIVIFIIQKERGMKEKNTKEELIPFLDENYEQIFIDNLFGKDNSIIFNIIQKNNNNWFREYLILSNFIEENIELILSYMNISLLLETDEINKNNFSKYILNKISNNDELKKLIINSLVKQGEKHIKKLIKNDLINYENKENAEDFFQIISNNIKIKFVQFLLNIIYNLLKQNIFLPLINNFDIVMKNEYLNHIIKTEFENISFISKTRIHSNKINIYINLKIPKIKNVLDHLVNYVKNEIFKRYLKIEGELRKFKNDNDNEISNKKNNYNAKIELFESNIKNEINKNEVLRRLYEGNDNNIKKLITEDYLYYFIINCAKKENVNYNIGEKLLNLIKLILQLKFEEKGNYYEFKYSFSELSKIILFTQGYKEDIKDILTIFEEFSNYCENIHERIIKILDEKIINYEKNTKNKNNFQITNKHFYILIEAFIRCILLFSLELNKIDKIKFKNFFDFLNQTDKFLQNLNIKFSLFSKEIINLKVLLKIEESCEEVYEQFETNYKKIITNSINQTNSLYRNNYVKYLDTILDLIKIIDNIFTEKNDKYINLVLFIIKQGIINLSNENLKIYFIENLIKNELIQKRMKIFLSLIFYDFKPKIKSDIESEEILLQNFLSLENKSLKLKEFIKGCNELKSPIFNEVLLHFFECQCQSYFLEILNRYKNNYSEKCCQELLSNMSLIYLKKAIKFLDNENAINNNLLKLNAIGYIKTYCYYYVEINFKYFDKCNFNKINQIFPGNINENNLTRNMRILYFWRLYYKKFENFEQFTHFDFKSKYISFYLELKEKLSSDEKNSNIISKHNLHKELIMGNYEPSIYNQNDYPDIQYYTIYVLENMDLFIKEFKSSEENKNRYALINNLLNQDLINNVKKLKCLNDINNLTNILLKKYNSKITREKAKKILFKDEIEEITNFYNKISGKQLTKKEFENSFVKPFFDSWEIIKSESVRYKLRILRNLQRGEKPLDMNENLTLDYFLIDNGDVCGGMFLASAYERMICWQNEFIDSIIEKNNKINGPLNKYISQLEQEIDIQDASPDETINIDDNIFEIFQRFILESSRRNIFTKDNKIDYKNNNDIIYDFDYIEEKLGELILLGKKRFGINIRFIKYLFEEFVGDNIINLCYCDSKYGKRELNEKEQKSLFEFIKDNFDTNFLLDIYSSLLILLDIISKENYLSNTLIYKIIETLPTYININEKLVKFFREKYQYYYNLNLFSVDSLISIFEIFEDLCWKEIKKNIGYDYELNITEELKIKIKKYFEDNKNEEKLINKNNITSALRKFISRILANRRQEQNIRNDRQLILYIRRSDLWKNNIEENENFDIEIMEILTKDIIVGQTYDLYNILEGDSFLNKFIDEKIFGKSIIEEININNEPNENTEEQNNGDDNEEVEDDDDREDY